MSALINVTEKKTIWDYDDEEDSEDDDELMIIFDGLTSGRGPFDFDSILRSSPPSNDNPQTFGTPKTSATNIKRSVPDGWNSPEDDVYEDESTIMLALAQQNYEAFYKLKAGTASAAIIEHTSAGIAGWASCVLLESPTKATKTEQDGISEKRSLEDAPQPNRSSPLRKRGDEKEARELQLALLESIGVNVGNEAKRNLLHDVTPFVESGDESEDESNWSIEDDGIDGELECISLQSNTSNQEDGNGETGFLPLAEGLCIASSDSDDTASSFVVVLTSNNGSSGISTSSEEDGNGATGLSPLAGALRIDKSENEDQDSAESFVNVPSSPQDSDHSTSSSNDWALL